MADKNRDEEDTPRVPAQPGRGFLRFGFAFEASQEFAHIAGACGRGVASGDAVIDTPGFLAGMPSLVKVGSRPIKGAIHFRFVEIEAPHKTRTARRNNSRKPA